jgi:hypothetical protein
LLFQKWTILWRSIILSSFNGKTYKPYCHYVRVLDFRNLTQMLEDDKFQGETFFAGELEPFFFQKAEYSRTMVDVFPTINAVGDAISQRTNLVEEISGPLSPRFLPKWIAQSPRLQSLVLWHGGSISHGAGKSIRDHCEYFKTLTIREWLEPDADQLFADFLTSLNANTLEYVEMISYSNLERLSFEAMGAHKQSLKELKLGSLSRAAIENLNCLKDCTSLHTIFLEEATGSTQLERFHNDVFVEVIEWLSSCPNLRDLTLQKFYDGPAILAQVLSSPTVRLTKLSLEGYHLRRQDSAAFHAALAEQKSLESLWLRGNGEDASPEDLTTMVEALCNLSNLRELVLKDISDEFEEHHIASLALNLPLLEDLWTSGGEIGGDVLSALASLTSLKNLTLYAMTQFSCEEIIGFLSLLDEKTQRGFNLALMTADLGYDLNQEEQDLIRDVIRTKLEGRFDFVVWRENDSEED